MADRAWRRTAAFASVAAFAGACATASYSPCPVGLDGGVPAHAFAACRDVLARSFGAVVTAEAAPLRLQTAWAPAPGEACERRATVFELDDAAGRDLAVVVEVRRLAEPLLGMPAWTDPRGDAAAERELATLLREAVSR